MSLVSNNIDLLRSAVYETHAPGGIKLQTTGTVSKNTLTNDSCGNLRVGQGVQIGGETFTVLGVSADGKSATLDRQADINTTGSPQEVYTDGPLLNLKTVSGKTAVYVDPVGNLVLNNGRIPAAAPLNVPAIKTGAVVLKSEAMLEFKVPGSSTASIGKLGLVGSYHSFTMYNPTAAEVAVKYTATPGAPKTMVKLPANSSVHATLFIKAIGLREDGKEPNCYDDQFDIFFGRPSTAVPHTGPAETIG